MTECTDSEIISHKILMNIENRKMNDSSNPNLLESVRDYLIKNGGKVKQDELLDHFHTQLSDPSHKHQTRAEFKDILQFITAVKIENGEKYIVLTKQNKHEYFQTFSLMTRKSKRFRDRHAKAERSFQKSTVNFPLNSHHEICSTEDIHRSKKPERTSTSSNSSPKLVNKTSGSSDSLDMCPLETDYELGDDISFGGITAREKEWMIACTRGNLLIIKRLVKETQELLDMKDFVFGYTILHWAAKLGRADIINFVADHNIDIHHTLHVKSHGGFTALHIAAMSGKDSVIVRLIELGANIHARDYSGKKAKDLVTNKVEENVQRSLGKTIIIAPNTILHSNVSNLMQQNKIKRSSSFRKPPSRESSPDLPHKGLNKVQRSMSLLRTKMHSPMLERPKSRVITAKSKLSQESQSGEVTKALVDPQLSFAV